MAVEGDPQPHDHEVCELVVREDKAGRPRAGEVGEDGLSAGPMPCSPSQASSNFYFRFWFRGIGWAEAGAGPEGAAFSQAPTRPGGSCTSHGADPRGQTDANMPPLCRMRPDASPAIHPRARLGTAHRPAALPLVPLSDLIPAVEAAGLGEAAEPWPLSISSRLQGPLCWEQQ